MFQITIIFLYLSAGAAFAASRLPKMSASAGILVSVAFLFAASGVIWHSFVLYTAVIAPAGVSLSIGNAVSFIGLQMALIAMLGAVEPTLRGMAGSLLMLAGLASSLTEPQLAAVMQHPHSWQLKAHILVSLFAYGLLGVGAIVAVFALIQDGRLRAGQLSAVNQLFAPLETNEKLLYGIASSGFIALLVAIISGFMFVDNLFAQHLAHKSVLSILALGLFGALLIGRQLAGWRGRRAVYLYLWGFAVLCLAYFGSRYVLENILNRSWG